MVANKHLGGGRNIAKDNHNERWIALNPACKKLFDFAVRMEESIDYRISFAKGFTRYAPTTTQDVELQLFGPMLAVLVLAAAGGGALYYYLVVAKGELPEAIPEEIRCKMKTAIEWVQNMAEVMKGLVQDALNHGVVQDGYDHSDRINNDVFNP